MEEGTCTCEGAVPSLEMGDHSDSHLGVLLMLWDIPPGGLGPQSLGTLGTVFIPPGDAEPPWYTLPGACSWIVDPR